MNKNIFKATLLCTALLAGTTVNAAVVDKIQPEGSKVYVEGNGALPGSVYPVTVVKKDADLNKLTDKKPDVYYQGEITVDENGETDFVFKMPSRSETGDYVLRILDGSIINEFGFYYLSSLERQALIDKINSGVKANITDVLVNNWEDLGLTLANEAKIDVSGVAERIYKIVTETPGYETKPVFTEETFISAYKEAVISEAFTQKKNEFLIEDGILKYDEYTKINESVFYGEYMSNLSESGIAFVNNAVISEGCSSLTGVKESFEKNSAFAVVCRYKDEGYGHVNDMLARYKDVFRNDFMIDFTYYDVLTENEKITFARELNVSHINSAEQLKSKIEDTARNVFNRRGIGTTTGGSGGSGGSGKGSGGGGGTTNLNVNVSAPSSASASGFSDLYSVEWARTSIEYLAGRNIVCGKAEGMFYPNDNITREEFVKIICLAFNISTDGAAAYFADVNVNDWYYPYVSALYNKGIISGVGGVNFGTGTNITREQMAVIIARILNINSSGAERFSDDDNISAYAKDAVYAMKEKGIINGIGNNLFNPQGLATRAEAAKIVYSAITNQ